MAVIVTVAAVVIAVPVVAMVMMPVIGMAMVMMPVVVAIIAITIHVLGLGRNYYT